MIKFDNFKVEIFRNCDSLSDETFNFVSVLEL